MRRCYSSAASLVWCLNPLHRVPTLMPAASLARSISRLPRYCSASTCSPFTASASLYLASAWHGDSKLLMDHPWHMVADAGGLGKDAANEEARPT